ncbi:MAG: FimV/HubP family polar landmark protein [Burkholderiales bacterium]
MPWAAHAAGLGKLTVNSGLGQALNAEIELLGVQKSELDTLSAKLAGLEAFRKSNIELNSTLSAIKFSFDKKPDGQVYLKLKTAQPVNEPFLDFLIELNWASGRLVKEYTVLLDPPGFEPRPTLAAPAPAPAAVPEAQALPAPAEAPKPEVAAVPPDEKVGAEAPAATEAATAATPEAATPEAPAPEAATLEAPPAEEKKTYGPIKRGDTLRKIAEGVKPADYTLEQMLVGLLRSNKEAFVGNNMNRMKTGPILRVPESSELSTIDPKAAVKEVRVQARDWNAYRQKIAEAAGQATPADTAKQSASGKISTQVEDKAAPREPGKEVLKLSKGEAGGGGKGALQDRLRTLEEEVIAREKTVKEASERIAMLEKNIQDMQKLLEIKNQSLARVQSSAAKQAAPQPAANPAEKTAAAPAPQQQTEVKPPAGNKPKVVSPPPALQTSLLDDILDNPLYLGGGAGLIIALLGLGYIAARKKKSVTRFEDSVINPDELKSNTVFGNAEGGVVNTSGENSVMSDFAGKVGGAINTDDVDPLAEAEVYIAYGRDGQAEEILKDALKKDPARQEVQLKLLEIYSHRKSVSAVESIASALYAKTRGKGAIWEKAAQLGYKIDPANPMYASAKDAAEGKQESAPPPRPPQMDFNIGLPSTGEPTQAKPDIAFETGEFHTAESVDISFDLPAPALPETPSAGVALDIDTGSLSTPAEPAMDMINFNFEPSKPAAAASVAAVPSAPDALQVDFSRINLTLDQTAAAVPSAESAKDSRWNDVQTKFDLAKAYSEMGDKEGAREILQEVVQEGDPKQQEAAKGLLARL